MRPADYAAEVERTVLKGASLKDRLSLFSMGLMGEGGELVNYFKHVLIFGRKTKREVVVEGLGDTLWYVVALANSFGIPLSEIMEYNVKKLRTNYPEGFSTERSLNREEQ